MHAIHKYQVAVEDEQRVRMPKGARILDVQAQGPFPCIWAIVDTEAELEERRFAVRGTGHELDDELATATIGTSGGNGHARYIGTFQLHGGNLVFHLFERV